MEQKDYDNISNAIYSEMILVQEHGTLAGENAIRYVAEKIAIKFINDPDFDRDKFLRDCGIE